MSRRLLLFLVAAAVTLALAGGIVVGGGLFYLSYRQHKYLNTANELYAADKWLDAKTQYSYWLGKHKDDVESLQKYASCSLMLIENRPIVLRDAASAYNQILQREPDNQAVMQKIYDIHLRTAAWPNLEYFASLILSQRPDDWDALYYQALAQQQLSRTDNAITMYTKLVDMGAPRSEVYGNLAKLLRDKGKEEQAVLVLEKALATFPDNPLIHLERHKYFVLIGKRDEAAAELALAAKLPDNPDVLSAQASFAMSADKMDEAKAFAMRLLEVDPKRRESYGLFATVCQRRGELQAAMDLIKNMDPYVRADSPNLWMALIEMQINRNLFDDAHQSIDSYLASYPGHKALRDYFAGREHLAKNELDEAIQSFSIIRHNLPEFETAQLYLAMAYLQNKQRDLARVSLQAYITKNPQDEAARVLLITEFPDRDGQENMEQLARTLLQNRNADPAMLVSTASALFEAAVRKSTQNVVADSVKEVIEEAIRREPSNPRAYQVLVDIQLTMNNANAATQSITRAIEAGIPESELRVAKGAVSLASNDIATAQEMFADDLGQSEKGVDSVIAWARLFNRYDHKDLALECLTKGQNKLGESSRFEIEIERARLHLRAGDLDSAMEIVDALASTAGEETKSPLNALRIDIADELIASSTATSIERAELLTDSVVQSDAGNITAQLLKAEVLLRKAPPDPSRARSVFERVLSLDSTNVRALIGLAGIAFGSGDLQSAITYAKQGFEADPGSMRARLVLAELYNRQRRFAESQSLLEPVVDANPTEIRAVAILVGSYEGDGQSEEAEALMAKTASAIESNPEAKKAFDEMRGEFLFATRNEEAENVLRQQYAENPDSLSVTRNLAFTLARQKKFAEGEDILAKYVNDHKDDIDGLVALAGLYLGSNDPQYRAQASTVLTQALLKDPNHLPALREMIRLNAAIGNAAETLAYCDRYLKLVPDDSETLYRKATMFAQMREYESALETIQRVLTVSERPDYLSLRGVIHLTQQRYQEAIADLQAAARGMTTVSPNVELALAEAFLGANELEKAKEHFDLAAGQATNGVNVDRSRLERVRSLIEQRAGKV